MQAARLTSKTSLTTSRFVGQAGGVCLVWRGAAQGSGGGGVRAHLAWKLYHSALLVWHKCDAVRCGTGQGGGGTERGSTCMLSCRQVDTTATADVLRVLPMCVLCAVRHVLDTLRHRAADVLCVLQASCAEYRQAQSYCSAFKLTPLLLLMCCGCGPCVVCAAGMCRVPSGTELLQC